MLHAVWCLLRKQGKRLISYEFKGASSFITTWIHSISSQPGTTETTEAFSWTWRSLFCCRTNRKTSLCWRPCSQKNYTGICNAIACTKSWTIDRTGPRATNYRPTTERTGRCSDDQGDQFNGNYCEQLLNSAVDMSEEILQLKPTPRSSSSSWFSSRDAIFIDNKLRFQFTRSCLWEFFWPETVRARPSEFRAFGTSPSVRSTNRVQSIQNDCTSVWQCSLSDICDTGFVLNPDICVCIHKVWEFTFKYCMSIRLY